MNYKIIIAGLCLMTYWSGPVQGQTTNIFTNVFIRNTLRQSTNSVIGGTNSTALGYGTKALTNFSYAEGHFTVSSNIGSHAEGGYTKATGLYSHVEGGYSMALGSYSHAEGYSNTAFGVASHAEGRETDAGGDHSHAEGFATDAGARNSHAGGAYAMVQTNHTNAFIHATGTSNAMKVTLFPDTAHFDRLVALESANDTSNAVLTRYENDQRYATTAQGALASSALQPNTIITVETVRATSAVGINTNASSSNALAVAGNVVVGGIGRFEGIRIPQQGDISMGAYTNGAF